MTDTREAFPALGDLAYLNNAATTQKPLRVLDALRRFYLVANANPHRGTCVLTIKATGCP